MITDHDLSKAVQQSISAGLPVGRVLVLSHALEQIVVSMALEILVQARDAFVTREETVIALTLLKQSEESMTPAQKLQLSSFLRRERRRPVRLGELMVLTGVLSEVDVLLCLEIALESNKMIGQTLVDNGYVSNELLEISLELQQRIEDGQLEPSEAVKLLSRRRFDAT